MGGGRSAFFKKVIKIGLSSCLQTVFADLWVSKSGKKSCGGQTHCGVSEVTSTRQSSRSFRRSQVSAEECVMPTSV